MLFGCEMAGAEWGVNVCFVPPLALLHTETVGMLTPTSPKWLDLHKKHFIIWFQATSLFSGHGLCYGLVIGKKIFFFCCWRGLLLKDFWCEWNENVGDGSPTLTMANYSNYLCTMIMRGDSDKCNKLIRNTIRNLVSMVSWYINTCVWPTSKSIDNGISIKIDNKYWVPSKPISNTQSRWCPIAQLPKIIPFHHKYPAHLSL